MGKGVPFQGTRKGEMSFDAEDFLSHEASSTDIPSPNHTGGEPEDERKRRRRTIIKITTIRKR